MSREDAKPEAVAKIEERRDGKVMESRASGPGAAAAAGRERASGSNGQACLPSKARPGTLAS